MLDFWMAGRLVVGQGVLVRGFFAFFCNEVTKFVTPGGEIVTFVMNRRLCGYFCNEVTSSRYLCALLVTFALTFVVK